MKGSIFVIFGTFVTLTCTNVFASLDGSLSVDLISAIKHPSNAAWSPDGKLVSFLWDNAGNQNLFIVAPGKNPSAITNFSPNENDLSGTIGHFEWISSKKIVFSHNNQLWIASTSEPPKKIPLTRGTSQFAVSPEKNKLAVVQDGALSLIQITGDSKRKLVDRNEQLQLSEPIFAPDGSHLSFMSSSVKRVGDILPYNGSKQALFRNETSNRKIGIVSTTGNNLTWIKITGRAAGLQWVSKQSVLFQEISKNMKRREIQIANLDGSVRMLRTDYDPRWWSPLRRDARTVVSPDGKQVAFFADETGWTHLYVMPTDGSVPGSLARKLTSGQFEVGFGGWSADGTKIAFYDNQDSPMERFIRIVDVNTGQIESIVTKQGVNYWPQFSPDQSQLVFERTDVENSVDLYVTTASNVSNSEIIRLTESMPKEIEKSNLTRPRAVYFPSRFDNKEVPGSLFVPDDLSRTEQHPAIVWIHGSGSEQNFLGWHPFSYRMYYSANQYLAQQGYIILAVDYRGSSGYGRDWGTGHHLDLGGSDALDVAAGADYLKTLPYVDPDRIGVWGLSYGGFLTLQAMVHTPKLFRCGIDVAGVTDWTTWGLESNGGWITGRMNSPEENPQGYLRTAPIKHMETLERPLLILHGTADVNVAFRESLNLVDVLLKLGKSFDSEFYPGEFHFFRRSHVLRDAWRRTESFFDTHLKSTNN